MTLTFLRGDLLQTSLIHPQGPEASGLVALVERLRTAMGDSQASQARALWRDLLEAAALTEQTVAEQRARIRALEALSSTDPLTGLLNRRGFEVEIRRALDRSARLDETGLLLLCDLDHFKAINDSCGHPAGDAVLRTTAHVLARNTRPMDYLARLGGDEFGVLLTNTPTGLGDRLADKLRATLTGTEVPWQGRTIPIRASLGWAVYDAGSTVDGLLFKADQALYRDKRPVLVS